MESGSAEEESGFAKCGEALRIPGSGSAEWGRIDAQRNAVSSRRMGRREMQMADSPGLACGKQGRGERGARDSLRMNGDGRE